MTLPLASAFAPRCRDPRLSRQGLRFPPPSRLRLRYPYRQRMIVACFYHWYTAGLYASPVILVGGWLFFASKRDRRRDKRDGGGPPAPSAPPQALSS